MSTETNPTGPALVAPSSPQKFNLAELQQDVLRQRALIEQELSIARGLDTSLSVPPKRSRAPLPASAVSAAASSRRREPVPSSRKSQRLSELPRIDMREEASYRDLPPLAHDSDDSDEIFTGAGSDRKSRRLSKLPRVDMREEAFYKLYRDLPSLDHCTQRLRGH